MLLKPEDYPLTLHAKDIMEIMRLSEPTVYALMRSKGFPLVKVGRKFLVPRDAFFEWYYEQARASMRGEKDIVSRRAPEEPARRSHTAPQTTQPQKRGKRLQLLQGR
ncbi:helix-turn-helix domain-containing protein [Alicyclobacillus tolerans]|uniref:helix-turn-helix domain-containing protein n=1 Tax=Alicyclobacillus tolerans TaxID=90970 RepID=UPI001F3A7211|nr:helix-turn-helix domain-containing protein [Alicyclobacillus tolerans]MCF8567698.1 helix-turn-helix domain-containing protein [Alicyclobacillus tolerans]